MLFVKKPLILPFLCHKSATTCQIDSYKVSNSKLKPEQCRFLKDKMTESTAPPQQPHKRNTIFGTPYIVMMTLARAFSLSRKRYER